MFPFFVRESCLDGRSYYYIDRVAILEHFKEVFGVVNVASSLVFTDLYTLTAVDAFVRVYDCNELIGSAFL
jgi:hypothetical protein